MTDTFRTSFQRIQDGLTENELLKVHIEPFDGTRELETGELRRAGTPEAAALVAWQQIHDIALDAYMSVLHDVGTALGLPKYSGHEINRLAVEALQDEVDRLNAAIENWSQSAREDAIRIDELRRICGARVETTSEPAFDSVGYNEWRRSLLVGRKTYHDQLMDTDAVYAEAVNALHANGSIVAKANDAAGRDFIVAAHRVNPLKAARAGDSAARGEDLL